MRKLIIFSLLLISTLVSAEPSVDSIRVFKEKHKLQLLSSGKVIHEFSVALGSNPKGHKLQEGDGKTPEGNYTIDMKNSSSKFYKSFHISYPNSDDIASAKARGVSPGGEIMVHGQKNGLGFISKFSQLFDWTQGCIALQNKDVDIMWGLVEVGTKIEIKP